MTIHDYGNCTEDINDSLLLNKEVQGKRNIRNILILFGSCVSIVCIFLIHNAMSLQKVKIELKFLEIPSMCNEEMIGKSRFKFDNPSYYSPRIGPVSAEFVASGITLVKSSFPEFKLIPGESLLNLDICFRVQIELKEFRQVIFHSSSSIRDINILVTIPVHLSVLGMPVSTRVRFSKTLNNMHSSLYQKSNHLDHLNLFETFSKHILQILLSLLHTIRLSNAELQELNDHFEAKSVVEFQYKLPIIWDFPGISVIVMTTDGKPILTNVFGKFRLGANVSKLQTCTIIRKKDIHRDTSLIEEIFTAHNISLLLAGKPLEDDCYVQKLLSNSSFVVNVPGQIDGKPLFLRGYSLVPRIYEYDSQKKKCKIGVKVTMMLHDPLPIVISINHFSFDIYMFNFHNSTEKPVYLASQHLESVHSWKTHTTTNISFRGNIRNYTKCSMLIKLYTKDDLAFWLKNGVIAGSIANNNFRIPFSVSTIRITNKMNIKMFSFHDEKLNTAIE